MSDIILFIVEGKETEPEILDNLWEHFFRHNTNSKYHVTFNSNIHLLWNEMQEDDDLEILELLAERDEDNATVLEDIKDSISEIFLIFDYDGHAAEASDEEIAKMITFFDDETDPTRGKLFLSYPMAEALRHFNPEQYDFRDLTIEFNESFTYKKIVGQCAKFTDMNKINGEVWNSICSENLRKANFIVNDRDSLPENIESVSQELLFNTQLSDFISNQKIAVLSSFPLFIHYYIKDIVKRFQ